MKTIERALMFGAHPDDEIAMARTIARMTADQVVARRREEAKACDAVLNIHERILLVIDVSDHHTKRLEALATQTSQYAVFGKTAADFKADIAEENQRTTPCYDRFWLAERNVLSGFLSPELTATENHLKRQE